MKKKIVLVFIFALLTVFLAFAAYKVMNKDQDYYTKSDFVLDSNNKYIITTNMKWMTMQNDGGSNTNTYYQIDFNKNKIIKCVDKYVGFEGYEYKGKILYSKEISKKEKQDFEDILANKTKTFEILNKIFDTLTLNNKFSFLKHIHFSPSP